MTVQFNLHSRKWEVCFIFIIIAECYFRFLYVHINFYSLYYIYIHIAARTALSELRIHSCYTMNIMTPTYDFRVSTEILMGNREPTWMSVSVPMSNLLQFLLFSLNIYCLINENSTLYITVFECSSKSSAVQKYEKELDKIKL